MNIFENQKEIYDRISSEFVSGRELLSNSEVKGKLDMLVENKVATSVSGTYEMDFDTYSPYLLGKPSTPYTHQRQVLLSIWRYTLFAAPSK